MRAIKDDTITDGTLLVTPDVRISANLAQVGGITYPIHSISSIRVVETPEKRDKITPALCAIAVIAIFVAITATKSDGIAAAAWVVGAICAVLALLGLPPNFSIVGEPAKYTLILATTGQEHAVMESGDAEYVDLIKGAIETAIEEQSSPSPPAVPRPAIRLVPQD